MDIPALRRRLRPLPDLLFPAVLAALVWGRTLAHMDRYVDVALFDETRYLYQGLLVKQAAVALREVYRARAYALWYAALAHLWPDPLALHDAGFRLLAALLPGLVYALLRSYRVAAPWAWLLAWAYALSDVHLVTQPRVAHFAWALVLLGLLVFRKFREPWRWALLLAAVWLASYARPEFVAAFALLAILRGVRAWREPSRASGPGHGRRFPGPGVWPWAALALWMGGLYALMGSPLHESGRLLAAFAQHFAYRWGASYGVQGGAWGAWREVLERAFGPGVSSVGEAVVRNPAAVARHVARNALEMPLRFGLAWWTHVPVVLPLWEETALWAVASLLLAGHLVRRRCFRPQRWEIGVWLSLLAPSLVAMALVFPRQHYMLGPALAGMVALGAGVQRCFPLVSRQRQAFAWLLALALLVATPNLAKRSVCTGRAEFLGRALPEVFLHRQCFATDAREAILALRSLQRAYGAFQVVIPADYWEKNLEVYLPAGLQPVFEAPRHPKTEGYPVVVAPHGDVWVKNPALWSQMQALKAYGVRGAYCTRGKPWVLLLRLEPPQDFPLAPCRPRFEQGREAQANMGSTILVSRRTNRALGRRK